MIFTICDTASKYWQEAQCQRVESLKDMMDRPSLLISPSLIEQYFWKKNKEEINEMIKSFRQLPIHIYGFELGCGLVSLDVKQRHLIEQNGLVNQCFAKQACEVYLLECGIRVRIL